jgi:hypothetical protein
MVFRFFFKILFIFTFISCNELSNDNLDLDFENDFYDSIKKYKAKEFIYLNDGLVPQKNFFINSKLKYLKFRYNPELGFSERRVYFNFENDSIDKFILRKVTPDWKTIEGTNEDNFKFHDSIFIVYPKLNKTNIYYNNKKVKTVKSTLYLNDEKEGIFRIKYYTEKKFHKKALKN